MRGLALIAALTAPTAFADVQVHHWVTAEAVFALVADVHSGSEDSYLMKFTFDGNPDYAFGTAGVVALQQPGFVRNDVKRVAFDAEGHIFLLGVLSNIDHGMSEALETVAGLTPEKVAANPDMYRALFAQVKREMDAGMQMTPRQAGKSPVGYAMKLTAQGKPAAGFGDGGLALFPVPTNRRDLPTVSDQQVGFTADGRLLVSLFHNSASRAREPLLTFLALDRAGKEVRLAPGTTDGRLGPFSQRQLLRGNSRNFMLMAPSSVTRGSTPDGEAAMILHIGHDYLQIKTSGGFVRAHKNGTHVQRLVVPVNSPTTESILGPPADFAFRIASLQISESVSSPAVRTTEFRGVPIAVFQHTDQLIRRREGGTTYQLRIGPLGFANIRNLSSSDAAITLWGPDRGMRDSLRVVSWDPLSGSRPTPTVVPEVGCPEYLADMAGIF